MFEFEDNLLSLNMVPTIGTFEDYHGFGELAISSSEPYIETAPTSISEISLYQAICPDELMQPVLAESLTEATEYSLEENSTIEIPQHVGNENSCPGVKQSSKLESTPQNARRLKIRKAPKIIQQELSLEEIARLIEQATSDEEKRSLMRQRRLIGNRASAYVPI